MVQALHNTGKKVILVGHSLGGLTITLVGERVPQAIHRLVYLTAFCPTLQVPGSAATYNALPENAASQSFNAQIGNPDVTGAIRINFRSSDPRYWETVRQAFYNDVPMNDFIRFFVYLNPDLSLKAALQDARGTANRWGRIPRTFIRCTLDHAIPLALQDRMVREADQFTPSNPFDVRTLESSHSSFASMPDKLAITLAEVAQLRGQ